MGQAVSSQLITSGNRDKFQGSLCEIFGGQSGTGTDFALSSSAIPFHYYSTGVTYRLFFYHRRYLILEIHSIVK
jgi:hypothetical protein